MKMVVVLGEKYKKTSPSNDEVAGYTLVGSPKSGDMVLSGRRFRSCPAGH